MSTPKIGFKAGTAANSSLSTMSVDHTAKKTTSSNGGSTPEAETTSLNGGYNPEGEESTDQATSTKDQSNKGAGNTGGGEVMRSNSGGEIDASRKDDTHSNGKVDELPVESTQEALDEDGLRQTQTVQEAIVTAPDGQTTLTQNNNKIDQFVDKYSSTKGVDGKVVRDVVDTWLNEGKGTTLLGFYLRFSC